MPRIDYLSPAAVGNGLTAAVRQLKAWGSTGWDDAERPPGLYGKLSLFSFIVFCSNFLFMVYFYIVAGHRVLEHIRENDLIELLQAGFLVAGGLALFLSAVGAGPGWGRRVYILAGLGFLFVAGEELSWGQHIFGFPTPDFLTGINYQQEANLHNTNIVNVNLVFQPVLPILLYLVTITAFLSRRYRLGVVPLPSLWLAFFFLLASEVGNRVPLLDFLEWHRNPLFLILAIFLGTALLTRDKRLLALVLTITALSVSLFYLYEKFTLYHRIAFGEVQEYLLSLAALLYTLQLLRDSGGERWAHYWRRVRMAWSRDKGITIPHPTGLAERFRWPGRGWEYHSWRWIWPAACLLTVSGSIGLVVLDWQLVAAREREHQARFTQPPTIQSHSWNIYHLPERLIYSKDAACYQVEDADYQFFLHIIPIREADLPRASRAQGFQNLSFWYNHKIESPQSSGGKCIAVAELPDYPIAQISTGLVVEEPGPAGNAGDNTESDSLWRQQWEVRLDLDADYYRAAYQPIAAGRAGPPLERAEFDLYRYNNALYYFKESCTPVDTDARFFLHLIPENPEDLAVADRALGFANRDFDFNRRGHWFDGKCLAVVELPDYPIAEIRTGQFTAAGPLWEVALPAAN